MDVGSARAFTIALAQFSMVDFTNVVGLVDYAKPT